MVTRVNDSNPSHVGFPVVFEMHLHTTAKPNAKPIKESGELLAILFQNGMFFGRDEGNTVVCYSWVRTTLLSHLFFATYARGIRLAEECTCSYHRKQIDIQSRCGFAAAEGGVPALQGWLGSPALPCGRVQ